MRGEPSARIVPRSTTPVASILSSATFASSGAAAANSRQLVVGSVLSRGLRLDGVLGGAVAGVAAEDPPAEAGDAQSGDEERDAHPQPRGHPLACEKDHRSIIAEPDRRVRVLPS